MLIIAAPAQHLSSGWPVARSSDFSQTSVFCFSSHGLQHEPQARQAVEMHGVCECTHYGAWWSDMNEAFGRYLCFEILLWIPSSEIVAGLTILEDPGRFGPFSSSDRFKSSVVYTGQIDAAFKLQVLELAAPAIFPRAVMCGLEQKALDIVWHCATQLNDPQLHSLSGLVNNCIDYLKSRIKSWDQVHNKGGSPVRFAFQNWKNIWNFDDIGTWLGEVCKQVFQIPCFVRENGFDVLK